MTLKLILRDRAVRSLVSWLPLGVLIGLILASNQQEAVRHGLTVGAHGFQGFRYIAYLPWGFLALHLLYAGVNVRCDRLDLTLPLPGRTLWLARVLALILSQWALIGTAAVTLLLRNQLAGFQVLGRTRVESLLAQLAAVTVLAVVLARLPRPPLSKIPFSPRNTIYLALVWAGALGLIFVFAGDPPALALLPLAVALALGFWVFQSLPESFVLVPREPEGQNPPSPDFKTTHKTTATQDLTPYKNDSRWLLHRTIWRACYGHWTSWLGFALLLALGFATTHPEPAQGLNSFWLFPLCWLLFGVLFGGAISRLHMLDPLPVPRKLIFAYTLLPGLLVASLSYLGFRLIRTEPAPAALVDYRQHPLVDDLDIRLPLEFWEISWDGDPSPVEEPYVPPWEEAFYPWSVSLFEGLPIVLYSPYHVPDGSSPEFVARQLSRAVQAAYGVQIPPEEIQGRYLLTRADGSVGLRSGGITLQKDYPGLKPTSRAQMIVLLIGLPWLLYLALVVRGGFISPVASRLPRGPLVLVALSALLAFTSLWFYAAGYTQEWKVAALSMILLRKLSALLPGGAIVRWGIVLLAIGGAYLLAQTRFERVEISAATSSGFGRW
jgi:hypothetical protein